MTEGCEVTGLRVATKRSCVLVESVDLKVGGGRIMGVVGETGAGKTLTMRALLGLLPFGLHADGVVRFGDGTSVGLNRVPDLRRMLGSQTGVVFQNPVGMLDPLMRVGEQLIEGVVRRKLMSRAASTGRAEKLLTQMGFTDPARVQRLFPHELSGGMAQRVVTAMAMMPRPELLVLDEPTSALDANVRVEVLKLFESLARDEGTAVFLVSHDLSLVSRFCDSLAVMYAGRVVERGRTTKVLRAPAHPYTDALLRSSVSLTSRHREALPVIAGTPPAPGRWPTGCVFSPRCDLATRVCHRERPILTATEGSEGCAVACHHPLDAVEA